MEFRGRLRGIYPKRLVDPVKKNDLQIFFLTLGMIFFEHTVLKNYRKPTKGEATPHAGEYGGMLIWIHKTFVAYINEFFLFIKENRILLESDEFQKILLKLDPKGQSFENWEIINKMANDISPQITKFSKSILKIRNNVSFHFEHAGTNLKRGYASKFFSSLKNAQNKKAFYSLEDTIEETRFYFSDAAVEQYIFNLSHNTPNEDKLYFELDEEYRRFVTDAIKTINLVIISLMKAYLPNLE